MEGGADEELDYDFKEEFQDDEENNTFYQDREEEEEAKLQEVSWSVGSANPLRSSYSPVQEQLKKEFRMANANVGDRPQIESDGDDEDEMEGDRLNAEGKRLRKMMKRRGAVVNEFGESDSVS